MNGEKDSNDGTPVLKPKGQKVALSQLGWKIDYIKNAMNPIAIPSLSILKKQKVASSQLGRKIDHVINKINSTAVSFLAGQTGYDTGSTKQNATQLSQKVKNIEIAKEETSCLGCIVI